MIDSDEIKEEEMLNIHQVHLALSLFIHDLEGLELY